MKTSIVTTTIHIPVLLEKYAQNARSYGHSDLEFIIVGDRKSPAATGDFCATVEQYFPCIYLDISAQQRYLNRFPELWNHLPLDSIQRRNIGMLMAYEHGAETVITIDDDNFVLENDFVGLHSIVGARRELPTYASKSGWFNVCTLLQSEGDVQFYHRGYPQNVRGTESQDCITTFTSTRRIVVNAGLWIDNPDIDAVSRIERQPVVQGFGPKWPGKNVALQPGTWSPFNSQNTALMREVIPAYFLSPYLGRYDDIWASYIVDCIADHLGDTISFGEPLVRQERNPHDLWRDLDAERDGMILTPSFCESLRAIPLQGSSYAACLPEIIHGLEERWSPAPFWTDVQRHCRDKLLEGLMIWHTVVHRASECQEPKQDNF